MSRRSASAVIDLTSSLRSHRHIDLGSQGPAYPPEPRGIKRRRTPGSTDAFSPNNPRQTSSHGEDDNVESVDLTEVNDDYALAKTLAKQREDAIKAQAATENREGRTTLIAFKCAICMDTPTDATTTVCGMFVSVQLCSIQVLTNDAGHMFCHKCIIDSLRYEEERSEATTGKSNRGKCPACRKVLSRKDTPGSRRDLIPLQFKLKTPS